MNHLFFLILEPKVPSDMKAQPNSMCENPRKCHSHKAHAS